MSTIGNKGLDVSDSAERVAPETNGTCPLCGKKTHHEMRPFCSRRCANVDLNRWLSGNYVVLDSKE
ncbi:MAG: DNA gyrase inhibitor YacG [Fimbriimonadaceae bacterium]|nr:DNA gyrase inhibitor YacG [Alphaproteobacteria bacterium]